MAQSLFAEEISLAKSSIQQSTGDQAQFKHKNGSSEVPGSTCAKVKSVPQCMLDEVQDVNESYKDEGSKAV